jgi:ribosome-associated protein
VAKKGLDVLVLDLRGMSSYADFLVIASGTSDRHVQALAESAEDALKAEGVRPSGVEGLREGQWALVDFGPVVLHVFHQYSRAVYDLEGMLRGAPRLKLAPAFAPAAQARH